MSGVERQTTAPPARNTRVLPELEPRTGARLGPLSVRRLVQRRLTLDEHISVLFESRETVTSALLESIRSGNGWDERRIEEEFEVYRHLVPLSGVLSATFRLHGGPTHGAPLCEELARQSATVLRLRVGCREVGAEPIIAMGAFASRVQHFRFAIGNDVSASLMDPDVDATLTMRVFGRVLRAVLPFGMRKSLSAQLADYSYGIACKSPDELAWRRPRPQFIQPKKGQKE